MSTTPTRTVAKGVALGLGLLTCSVNMSSAVMPRPASNVMVCTQGHPPARVRSPKVCPHCGEVDLASLGRARPVGDGLVMLTEEDLAQAKAPAEETKRRAAMTVHPRDQVDRATQAGEKAYFLTPTAGHEAAYATLAALIEAHPELAFVTRWTPRSEQAMFQVSALSGVLLMQERTLVALREAPEVKAEVEQDLVVLAERLLKKQVTRFDPTASGQSSSELLDALVAGRPIITVEADETVTPPTRIEDLRKAMKAELAARRAPRKSAAGAKGVA